MRKILLLILIFASPSWASGYISNAFQISTGRSSGLFSNRDIECVAIVKGSEGKYIGKFWLNPIADKALMDFTSTHRGETLLISLCGDSPQRLILREGIKSPFDLSLTPNQKQCLEDSFDMSKPCRDCPVCKQ